MRNLGDFLMPKPTRPVRSQLTRKSRKEEVVDSPQRGHRIRLRMIGFFMTLTFCLISGRLVQFQLDPDMRFDKEDLKHIGKKMIERPRGNIYDANGRVLATNRKMPTLAVDPSRVEDPHALVNFLAARMDLSHEDLYERVTRTGSNGRPKKMVYLHRRMSTEAYARLADIEEAPDRRALMVQYEPERFYPEKDLAAQILGFANREGRGAEGIEAKFDGHLFSEAGEMLMRVDNARRVVGKEAWDYKAPTGGDDVVLTIDAQLQFTLEQELDNAMERTGAARSMGLLMDPHTGAILAMATRPAFDPNDFNSVEPEFRRNRVVTDFFEPGSAFKIVTAAAALELGLVTRDTPIDCMGGGFNPYGKYIRDTHPANVIPFSETFAQSSNVAIIKVGALLGEERMEHWIRRFGFGSKTGLEVQLESAGLFRGHQGWSRLSMGSLPMGHEIGVTMPQLARAFSVIANGGELVRPHLEDRIVNQEGEVVYAFDDSERKRVVSEDTAAIMRELAHQVIVSDEGTGKRAAIREYRVGGKTGTAQIAKPDGTGYYAKRYNAVFAGFAPADDPQVTAVIVVQEPEYKKHYGGYAAAPVFREVVRDALVRMHTKPDPMDPEFFVKNKRYFTDVARVLDADTVVEFGALEILEPSFEEEEADRLELVTASADTQATGPRLPSFLGLTKRQAKLQALELGIDWDPQGAGRVVRQDPIAGTPLGDVRVCKLVFGHHVEADDA